MRSHRVYRILITLAVLLLPATFPAAADQQISVGGTTNLAPLVAQAGASYQSTHAGVTVSVKGDSSGQGIADLKDHHIDVAMSDVAVNDDDFSDTILGVVGFAFVVNPDVGVKNLTRAELEDIFAGKITNWKTIGGNDRAIVLIGREIGTGTRFVFEDKVAKTLVPITVEKNAVAVVQKVAQTSGAIGYLASGFIGNYQNLVVSYEGVMPTPDNIRHHIYPFATDEHLYMLKSGSPAVAAFIEYVKNDRDVLRANGVFQSATP